MRPVGALHGFWFQHARASASTPLSSTSTLAVIAARADLGFATARVELARRRRLQDLTCGASAGRLEQTSDDVAVFGSSILLNVFHGGGWGVGVADAPRDQTEALSRVMLLDADHDIPIAQAEAANADASSARMGIQSQ